MGGDFVGGDGGTDCGGDWGWSVSGRRRARAGAPDSRRNGAAGSAAVCILRLVRLASSLGVWTVLSLLLRLPLDRRAPRHLLGRASPVALLPPLGRHAVPVRRVASPRARTDE